MTERIRYRGKLWLQESTGGKLPGNIVAMYSTGAFQYRGSGWETLDDMVRADLPFIARWLDASHPGTEIYDVWLLPIVEFRLEHLIAYSGEKTGGAPPVFLFGELAAATEHLIDDMRQNGHTTRTFATQRSPGGSDERSDRPAGEDPDVLRVLSEPEHRPLGTPATTYVSRAGEKYRISIEETKEEAMNPNHDQHIAIDTCPYRAVVLRDRDDPTKVKAVYAAVGHEGEADELTNALYDMGVDGLVTTVPCFVVHYGKAFDPHTQNALLQAGADALARGDKVKTKHASEG